MALDDRQAPPAGLHPKFCAHVVSTYTPPVMDWLEVWVGRSHDRQREAMRLLLAQSHPEEGASILAAAQSLGLDYTETCKELTYRLRAGKVWQPPPFLPNWSKEGRPRVPVEERRYLAHPCTNAACSGRGAGAGGRKTRERVVLASHILWTPETPTGVLCPSCRQSPAIPGCRSPPPTSISGVVTAASVSQGDERSSPPGSGIEDRPCAAIHARQVDLPR